MRLTDHEINPILSPCLAWFGGGRRKGPSESEKRAAQDQQRQMAEAAAKQARLQQAQLRASEKRSAATLAEQQKQSAIFSQQAADNKASQDAQLAEMKLQAEANKPAPVAQVDPGNPEADMADEVKRRKGLRKSILAGESSQAPMTTGYSTLG